MQGLDAWLEAPYVDASRREAEFEKWCEANDEDMEDPTAWDRFEEALVEQECDTPEDYDR